ncbi:hypothetical protein M0P65_05260 [Candidatus Gracilibacteria bacterium]|nr:hypothetical protein [Candidatus Gracilibacteria bacterium]
MNDIYEQGIPSSYISNGRIVWYELLLKDGRIEVAYPYVRLPDAIKTEWVLQGSSSKRINDDEVVGWKILD